MPMRAPTCITPEPQVDGAESIQANGSLSNGAEASRIVRILGSLIGAGLDAAQLGVVCLYRAQVALCQRLLAENGLIEGGVVVSTVDAFQGAEKDVIIVSTCRTSVDGQLNFIASPQRLNVTITRARHHLLIVGSAAALDTLPAWRAVLEAAQPIPAGLATGHSEAAQVAPAQGTAAAMDITKGEVLENAAAVVMMEEDASHSPDPADELQEPTASPPSAPPAHAPMVDASSPANTSAPNAPPPPNAPPTDAPQHPKPPPDDLHKMLEARRQRLREEEEMRVRVRAEMLAAMNTGVRPNPALAQALGVTMPAHLSDETDSVPGVDSIAPAPSATGGRSAGSDASISSTAIEGGSACGMSAQAAGMHAIDLLASDDDSSDAEGQGDGLQATDDDHVARTEALDLLHW